MRNLLLASETLHFLPVPSNIRRVSAFNKEQIKLIYYT
jgi:hypothetical protein